MPTWIFKKNVIEQIQSAHPDLNLEEKTILNWLKEGRECPGEKNGNRICFDSDLVFKWRQRLEDSLITLNRDDYIKCFRFAVQSYYRDVTRSDFERTTQRDSGQFLTNQTQGKLGEIAVQKLLKKHGLSIKLDFEVTGDIPSQDIAQISTRKGIWNNPAIKVSVKATKFKNILLAVPQNEATLEDRKSDAYVLTQVGLFPNHILRLIKEFGQQVLAEDAHLIPEFGTIPVRVSGWAIRENLTRTLYSIEDALKEFKLKFASPNFVLRSGELSTDWDKLKQIIISGFGEKGENKFTLP